MDYIRININNGATMGEDTEFFHYAYYNGEEKQRIELLIGNGNISIFFAGKCDDLKKMLDFAKTDESSVVWNNMFAEAYRKSMLLHVFIRNHSIHVDRIVFEQGQADESSWHLYSDHPVLSTYVAGSQSFVVDSATPVYSNAFPFIKLGVGEEHIDLDACWRDNAFLRANLNIVKSNWEGDYRVGSMFAFLRSNSLKAPVDRFVYLWISFNAYYNYMAARYEKACEKRSKKYSFGNDESRILNYFIRTLNIESDKLERKRVIKEQQKNSKENILFTLGYGFGKIPPSEYEEIYTQLEKPDVQENDVHNPFIRSCFSRAKQFHQKPFEMILVEYAYYLRNMTFHARQSAILYDDVSSVMDGTYNFVNYFLFRYLNEHIPGLFLLPDDPSDEEYHSSQSIIDYINEQYKEYCDNRQSSQN